MTPFTLETSDQIKALGEQGLISNIRRWLGDACPPSPWGIGDDCAVLPPSKKLQVITVDPVIYGRHFDATVKPAQVGAKLLKRNLSDIASMGAKPRIAVVALQLPANVSVRWLKSFYCGLAQAALHYDTQIVGGDIAETERDLVASLTLLGEATTTRVLTRSGAREGDHIWVTGHLGGSLQGHHHRFTPRLKEGAWLAAQKGVRAMMDVSDGLAKDLGALSPAGYIPAIDPRALPVRAAARNAALRSGQPLLHHVLCDGEDYELVFTVDRLADAERFARSWSQKFATKLSRIGQFVKPTLIPDGWINPLALRGYEHLR